VRDSSHWSFCPHMFLRGFCADVASRLGLTKLPQSRQWHVQAATATTNTGLYEGLEWLSRQMSGK